MYSQSGSQSHTSVHNAHRHLFSFLLQVNRALFQRIFIRLESPARPSLWTPSMLSDTALDPSLPVRQLPEQTRTFPFIYHPLGPVCPALLLSTAMLCFAQHAQPAPVVWWVRDSCGLWVRLDLLQPAKALSHTWLIMSWSQSSESAPQGLCWFLSHYLSGDNCCS